MRALTSRLLATLVAILLLEDLFAHDASSCGWIRGGFDVLNVSLRWRVVDDQYSRSFALSINQSKLVV